MTRHRRPGTGRDRRPIPAGTDLYAYTHTYSRRPGLFARLNRSRTAAMLLAAFAIVIAYVAACAYVVDRLFPGTTGGYWVAGLTAAAGAALLALARWARRG